MHQEKSLKLNIVMNSILTVSNFVFPLLTYAYVARILMPEGTGKINFVQALLAFFSYLASLGTYRYGIRECAKIREDKEKLSKCAQEIFFINMLATLVAYALLIIVVVIVQKFREYSALIAVMSIGIILNTLGVEWLYSALELYTYITVRSLTFKLISVGLIFLLVRKPEDYIIYGGLTIFASSASNVLNLINSRKYIFFKRYEHYEIKKHLKPIMVFFLSSIAVTVYGQFDSIMIGFIKGDKENGIYGATVKIKSVVSTLNSAFTAVMIPRISYYYEKNVKEQILSIQEKYMRLVWVIIVPFTIFIGINAEDVLSFVCGDEYLAGATTLSITMICVLVMAVRNLLGDLVLIPDKREGTYSKAVFIGMILNIAMNFIMIPYWGNVGAIIATLLTEIMVTLYMGKRCKENVVYIISQINYIPYMIATICGTIFFIAALKFTKPMPLFFRLCIDTVVLFGIYYGVLLLQKEEITRMLLATVLQKLKIKRNK